MTCGFNCDCLDGGPESRRDEQLQTAKGEHRSDGSAQCSWWNADLRVSPESEKWCAGKRYTSRKEWSPVLFRCEARRPVDSGMTAIQHHNGYEFSKTRYQRGDIPKGEVSGIYCSL
jgi:hypothetical protein